MAGLFLDQGWRDRVAVDHAAAALVGAWFGDPPESRAAMNLAAGDVRRAGAIAGGCWQKLAAGDPGGALREARGGRQTMAMALVEAEALMSAGAVVAALGRLWELHRAMYPPAGIALARHRHRLGNYAGAENVAMALPGHAQAAVVGAKAALMNRRAGVAIRLLEPFLGGVAPIPNATMAGAVATLAASALARLGRRTELERLAAGLLTVRDLAGEMAAAVARVAWTAGRAAEAWERFQPSLGAGAVAARVELALLAGDAALAMRLSRDAGPLGAASVPVLTLLSGGEIRSEEAARLLGEGRRVHVWRTHPHRWAPWIEAARASDADVRCFDLAAGELPDGRDIADVALDDGALLELVAPHPAPIRPVSGGGVWVEPQLCAGIGIGHDWPAAEHAALLDRLGNACVESPGEAAVLALSVESALSVAASGRPAAVLAPPGDPFWAGPLPDRVWPAFRVVRSAPREGWAGAGERMAEAVLALLEGAAGSGDKADAQDSRKPAAGPKAKARPKPRPKTRARTKTGTAAEKPAAKRARRRNAPEANADGADAAPADEPAAGSGDKADAQDSRKPAAGPKAKARPKPRPKTRARTKTGTATGKPAAKAKPAEKKERAPRKASVASQRVYAVTGDPAPRKGSALGAICDIIKRTKSKQLDAATISERFVKLGLTGSRSGRPLGAKVVNDMLWHGIQTGALKVVEGKAVNISEKVGLKAVKPKKAAKATRARRKNAPEANADGADAAPAEGSDV